MGESMQYQREGFSMATKAEIEQDYDTLKATFEGMVERIVEVATEAAIEHDLCEVLEETLKEIGVPVPEVTFVASSTVEKRYTMSAIEAGRLGLTATGGTALAKQVYDALEWNHMSDHEDTDYEHEGGDVSKVERFAA